MADKPLAIATYGFDGRIDELSGDNIGVKGKAADSKQFNTGDYVVRAIGELTDT